MNTTTPLKRPPGPPPIKNMFQLLPWLGEIRKNPLKLLLDMHAKFGDTFTIEVIGDCQIWTTNPDFAREILVKQAANFQKDAGYTHEQKGLARFLGSGLLTSNGDFWKRQRKLVAPALHTKRIEAYAQTMVEYTLDHIKHWRDGEKRSISLEMSGLTMRIVARTLFHTEVADAVQMVYRAMADLQNFAVGVQFSPFPTWLPTPMELRTRRAQRDMDTFVYQTIRERRASGEDKGDLLSMLLLTEDDDGNHMTDQQAHDEVITLLLAGHETTANTLNWTWVLLAQNPHIEAKLHAELDSVLQGSPPTLADLRRLPYTLQVIKESMRLYPPAYSISREAIADTTVNGYDIRKGMVCNLLIYGLHRDAHLWQDAEKFIPERFAPENEAQLPENAYLPFGGGPRICIGNSFAMMEAQLLLATIAQQYRLALAPGQPIEMQPMITLNPKGSLPMTLHRRESRAVPAPAERVTA